MDADFNWKKFFQTMNKGRLGFRSVVYSDDKVSIELISDFMRFTFVKNRFCRDFNFIKIKIS